jgi:hypothetical protein
MIILKLIVLAALVMLASFVVGTAAVIFMGDGDYGIGRIVLYGQLVLLASYELVAPVEYIFQRRLVELMVIWGIILAVVIGCSLWYTVRTTKRPYRHVLEFNLMCLGDGNKALKIVAAVLVLCQMAYVLVYGAWFNYDDWIWVGEASWAYNTGWINLYRLETGVEMAFPGNGVKYGLAPWPTLWAVLGKLVSVRPVIVAHVLVAAITILDVYIILYQIAKVLFDEQCHRLCFILFMSVIKSFAAKVTTYIWYMYTLSWQGKYWMTSIMFPMVLYCMAVIARDERKRPDRWWLLLGIVLMDTMLINSLGTLLGVTLAVCMGVAVSVVKRNGRYILNTLLVSVPEFIGMAGILAFKLLV